MLLDSLFVRSETTTLRSPATWFLEAMGIRETASGVKVSEAKAFGLSAYYCGLTMIAGTIAALPLNVYKRLNGNGRELAPQNPAYWLLHTQPNPEITSFSLRKMEIVHMLSRGNSYCEIQRDGAFNPIALWPLLPTYTNPIRDDQKRLWYQTRIPETGESRYLIPDNVLHVPNFTYNGLYGFGLIQLASEGIGLNVAQDAYAGKFFANGGNVSGTIESPHALKEESFKRLKSEIAEKFSGLTNAHRIAILEAGMKYTSMNPTHRESQLIEERRFSVEEWARWFNMPPHKLKELTHATFSNIEQQNIEWVVDTILPHLTAREQEYDRKLFKNRNLFYTKHVVNGLVRGDMASRYTSYATGRNWGWLSANDVRELEDMNPLPSQIGDKYLYPMNMTIADETPGPLEAAAQRVVRQEERSFSSKGFKKTYDADFERKVSEWLGVSEEKAKRYSVIAAHMNLIAAERGIDPQELRAAKTAMLVQIARGAVTYEEPRTLETDDALCK